MIEAILIAIPVAIFAWYISRQLIGLSVKIWRSVRND